MNKKPPRPISLSPEDMLRQRIDQAIAQNDDKGAKTHLDLLEKYLKTAKTIVHDPVRTMQERRKARDELMADLEARFLKLAEAEEKSK